MKAKSFRSVLVLIVLSAALLALTAGSVAESLRQGGTPSVVSYQGQVAVDGVSYDGAGFFKFAIVDATGATTYWSNAPMNGEVPNAAVSLAVQGGLFDVLLGDTTLPHMAPLSADVFDGAGRYLRVWFSSDGELYTQFSPDRRIAAVPYALQSQQAEEARNAWALHGNAGTDPASDFLGTTDAQPLVLRTNNTEQARVTADGNLGLGTGNAAERLTVRGNALILEDAPVIRSSITLGEENDPRSIYVAGRYAYVALSSAHQLAILDVSNPDHIVPKGYTSTNLSRPESVYVAGRYAYVASWGNDRLAIFDVSNPDHIVAKGYTEANLGEPISVYVAGRYAYIASYDNNRLAIFDVSDPDNIVAKGYTSANLDRPESVYIAGRYAYVASHGNHRLAIFDVSDPNNPVAKGYTSENLFSPKSVYVAGRYAYVASYGNHRLAIFDVSNPNNIVARGYASASLYWDPVSVYVAGRYAYVGSFSLLTIVDVSDPDNPVIKGHDGGYLNGAIDLHVVGRYIYVLSYESSRLFVYDLHRLESPALETGSLWSGSLQVSNNAMVGNDLAVQGGLNVGPGGALVGGDLGVEGDLRVTGSTITRITTVSTDTLLTVDQSGVVLVNNDTTAATITLPDAAAAKGVTFTIKRIKAGAVTVDTVGGTIDGAASQVLAAQYDFVTVVSNGATWFIIGR